MHRIMNKRLLCFLLCMIMLLGVALTSCGEKSKEEKAEEIKQEASEEARTLAMYLMSEKQVSESTRQSIENAVNRITKAKFTAQIKLYIYTEEEYYSKLEEAFAKRDEAKALGLLGTDQEEQDNENELSSETADGSQSAVEIEYPEIADYQVDIFYFSGESRYQKYVTDQRLKNLSSRLSESGGSAGQIRKYVSPSFFTALEKMNGGRIHAVPTNKRIGEYTYLLLNKEALNDAQRRADGGASFNAAPYTSLTCTDTKDFLQFIKQYYSEEYAPLYTNFDENELLINNLKFWGLDENGDFSDAFSVLGNYFDGSATIGQTSAYNAKIGNLLENDKFVEDLRTLFAYKNDGYYCTAEDNFAVGYVKGGVELVDKYKDKYEVIVLEKPTLDAETAYSDLFGVCSYTSDESRAMQILTHLNTNEEFRNLLLYGIEGTHYNLRQVKVDGESASSDEEGETYKVVERLLIDTDEEYKMSVHKTGNELLAYPEVGMAPNINDYSVIQNRDGKVDIYAGFKETAKYSTNTYKVNKEEMQVIRALSESIFSDYLNATDFDKFLNGDGEIKGAKARVNECAEVAKQLDGESTSALQGVYVAWTKANKFVK